MVQEVIGYEKMKKNYRQNKDKKSLLAANDLFFCDWKIYNLLRQPLGKLFYDKKKYFLGLFQVSISDWLLWLSPWGTQRRVQFIRRVY